MTDTIASIRATLAERLGLDSLSTAETARLEEVVNAAVANVLGDNTPALLDIYNGAVPGDLSVTVSSHSAGDSAIVLTGAPADTRRGDIVTDASGNIHLVQSVTGASVETGLPIADALTGTLTITRRSIVLPHSGQIQAIYKQGSSTELKRLRMGGETQTGNASRYQQVWEDGFSHVLLYPAPRETTFYTIRQTRAVAKDTTLDIPNGVLEAILARSIVTYVAWTSGQFQAVEFSRRDSKNLASDGASTGGFTRG